MAIYVGADKIGKIYVGQNEIAKIYVGQDLVYENAPANLFPAKFFDTDGVTVYNNGLGYMDDMRINNLFQAVSAAYNTCVSGFLYVAGKTTLTISGCEARGNGTGYDVACYDANHAGMAAETTTMGGTYTQRNNPNGTYTIPAGVVYIRFSAARAPVNAVVTLS